MQLIQSAQTYADQGFTVGTQEEKLLGPGIDPAVRRMQLRNAYRSQFGCRESRGRGTPDQRAAAGCQAS